MNFFEKILYFLQGDMERPNPYGWFHWGWIILTILLIVILSISKKKDSEKHLKIVLAGYGIVALILEILKQLIWSFNYDSVTSLVTWDYRWYAAPFQLCTTPIYVSIICLFLKNGKLRNSLLSFLAYYTILGSIMTILIPDTCFTEDVLVNIHTMYLHCGSLVVSGYLILTKKVKLEYKNIMAGLYVFLGFVFIANMLNIIFYNTGIIGDETFNMFFISPYFISTLPVYNMIQEKVPYIIYLLFYIFSIFIGSNIVFLVSLLVSKFFRKR